jgi:hypothetical protein
VKTLLALSVFFLLSITLSNAQADDSAVMDMVDTTVTAAENEGGYRYEDEESDDENIYQAAPDSLRIKERAFGKEQLRRLKSDPDLNYEQPPTVAESLWDRFLSWLAYIFNNLFNGAVNTDWGRLIVYAIGLALLVALVMLVLKINAFKVLYSGQGAAQQYQVLDENIHEMDFDRLIQDAIDAQDYRRGVRLLFLYALKLLSDRQLIHWQSGKTNHDYVGELNRNDLRSGLNELSFYFDYAWYGNFRINRDTFSKAQSTFADWKTKLG